MTRLLRTLLALLLAAGIVVSYAGCDTGGEESTSEEGSPFDGDEISNIFYAIQSATDTYELIEISSETIDDDYSYGNPDKTDLSRYSNSYEKNSSVLANDAETILCNKTQISISLSTTDSASLTTQKSYSYEEKEITLNDSKHEDTGYTLNGSLFRQNLYENEYTYSSNSTDSSDNTQSICYEKLTGTVSVMTENGTYDAEIFIYRNYQYGQSDNYVFNNFYGYMKIGENYYALEDSYNLNVSEALTEEPLNTLTMIDFSNFTSALDLDLSKYYSPKNETKLTPGTPSESTNFGTENEKWFCFDSTAGKEYTVSLTLDSTTGGYVYMSILSDKFTGLMETTDSVDYSTIVHDATYQGSSARSINASGSKSYILIEKDTSGTTNPQFTVTVTEGSAGSPGTTGAPSAPDGLSVDSATSSSLVISWNSVSGATSYKVYRASSPDDSYSLITTTLLTSFTDSDLSSSTTYYYKVAAVNTYGAGSKSSYASGTTTSGGSGSAPSTPTGLYTGSATASSLTLSWSSTGGASSYKVYRATSSTGSYSMINTVYSPSYTDSGLSSLTTYYYKVAASNSYGDSSQSSYVSGTTTSGGTGSAPATPTGLSVGATSSTSIAISWNFVSDATSYKVYRSSSSGGSYNLVGSPTAPAFTDSSLTASTTYYYKVTAVNSSGESSRSSYLSGTTSAGGSTFTPGTGSFSIPLGTYGSPATYIFKAGNLMEMPTAGPGDISYTYTATGDFTFMTSTEPDMECGFVYKNSFTVQSGGQTYLVLDGFKKTSGTASSIIGTYEYGYTMILLGSSTDTKIVMEFKADGTYSVTTYNNGVPNTPSTGTWDVSASTISGFDFVTINGQLYMYIGGILKQ